MRTLSCNQCQTHLVAYIQHELPLLTRQRMAHHLDTCTHCYEIYVDQQRLTRDLRQVVPLVGQGKPPPFERVWAAARLDTRAGRGAQAGYTLRYSLVMLAVTLVLLLPFAMDRRSYTLASPPTQPSPLLQRATPNSTASLDSGISVAFQINETPAPKLQSTLTPLLPDAISTP